MKAWVTFATILAILAIGWFGFNYALWGRFTGPPRMKDFEAIAREGQPIVQAISDYRSDHGLLPESWSDFVPAYLPKKPKDWSWEGTCLLHRAGFPHTVVGYWFLEGDSAHWHLSGDYGSQAINVPNPVIKKSNVPAGTIFNSRLAEYEKRISANPTEYHAYADKIAFVVFSQSNDVAISECKRAAGLFTNWWLPPMALAELQTNDSQAEQNFKSWVESHPTFINYWYLCRFYRDKDEYDAAFAALEKAAESSFVSQATQVVEWQHELQHAVQGKPSKPITETPDDAYWIPEGFALDAARFCCENRRYELALRIIGHCEPDEGSWEGQWGVENMAYQASAELGLGRFEAATDHARKAAEMGGAQSSWAAKLPLFLQAVEAHNTNFWFQAEGGESSGWTLFQKPEELQSAGDDTAENTLYRGFQNGRNGDWDAAIADSTKAIKIDPQYAVAYNLRAWNEFLKKDFDAAIKDASRAIQLNLNFGNAYGTRGWARYGNGNTKGALEDLRAAAALCGENSVESTEDRGLIEFINGHYQDGINFWQKAIQLDPSCQRNLQPWIAKASQRASR